MPSERLPLPEGTITYCFTDVVGSTVLWDTEPATARRAMVRHDALVEAVIADHNGMLVRPRGEGDSRFGVFRRATDAAAAALDIHRVLAAEEWETSRPIQVRIALHMGEAEVRDGDYYGGAVNRCARLRSLAHPGQTLMSDPVAEVIQEELPDGAQLHDFGVHRLKDLSRPEHVRGITSRGTRSDFPPIVSLDTVPNNLPLQLTSLIGRESDVAAINDRFATGSRLVTVTGPGGIGKTRLALHVAAEATERFRDGVFLVSLDAVSEPDAVALTIANTLDVGDVAGAAIDAVVERLGDDRSLLVLDNFEQVLPAAGVAAQLLASCPNACVLATSRERLHLHGEVEWPLRSLDIPDVALGNDAAAKTGAVDLFVDRARAVVPDFAVSDHNRDAVVEICRRLDGLPLAIELAAARSKLLAPAELLARLDSGGNVLGGRGPDRPARHQTLLNTIAWSHDMLTDAERTLLRRVSVFAGGATFDAIDGVCGEGIDVFDELDSLVDKSLVHRIDSPDSDIARFAMLRTIRDFATQQLVAAGEAEAIRDTHARHFAQIAQAGEATEGEHDNLLAALEWLIDSGDTAAAQAMCASLERFWVGHGQVSEGREWVTRVRALAGGDERARARLVLAAGMLAAHHCEFDEAMANFDAAEKDLRLLAMDELQRCLMARGNVLHELGEVDAARSTLSDALAIARDRSDDLGVALVLYNLGCIEQAEGDIELAEKHLAESLECARGTGDELLTGMSLGGLGQVHAARDDLPGARALHEECLALGRRLGDVPMICGALDALGDVALRQGRLSDAEYLLHEALALEEECGDTLGLVITIENLVNLAAEQGRTSQAATLLGAAASIREAEGFADYGADLADKERTRAELRTALGDANWTAAYGAGLKFNLAEGCAFARRERGAPGGSVSSDTVQL